MPNNTNTSVMLTVDVIFALIDRSEDTFLLFDFLFDIAISVHLALLIGHTYSKFGTKVENNAQMC